jgi:glycosyltransferase involved in cell wall biosynthesis
MLRALILSSLFPHEGKPTFGNFVERQALALAAREGVEVRIVSPIGLPPWPGRYHPHYRDRAGLPQAEDWKGLEVCRPRFSVLPGLGAGRNPVAIVRALAPLLEALRRDFPFDVIHADFFWPDGPAALALGRRFGVPVSIKARGSDILYWGKQPGIGDQIVAAGQGADGLLAVSGALRESMIDAGMPGERIAVHHTGIDRELFRPTDRAAAKARLAITGPLILTPASLVPGKGHDLALDAIARLPGANLFLAGEGPERGAIERKVAALGLGERVHLLGVQPHVRVAELMAAADVMLLTSHSEGLANVWVEALACGTPVVTLDVGGASEVLDRPEAGRLVPPDPPAIADAIAELIASPLPAERVRACADRFSWEANGAALFAHLSALALRQARRAA